MRPAVITQQPVSREYLTHGVAAMAVLNGVDASTVETLVKRLPKAELHIHIEGSLEPSMMLQVCLCSRCSVPAGLSSVCPPHAETCSQLCDGLVSPVEPLPRPSASSLMLRAVVQIAQRNNLMHLLPYKTLEEVQAAYNFGCLQVSAKQRHLLPHGTPNSCPPRNKAS